MFPLLKHKAVLKDRPDGVPVMATFLGSDGESGIEVDDVQRYQFWDVPNGNDLIDACKYTIMQRNPQWKVQYEDSLVDPLRTVLDVNCGEFAGGNRG